MQATTSRPSWLKVKARVTEGFELTDEILKRRGLTTVCRESGCPNIWECWSRREATFLILGDTCTRSCLYCRVNTGEPQAPDTDESSNVASAVAELNLKHVVITSVTRDDLPDGGAGAFATVTAAIKEAAPMCRVELLVPDFAGDERSVSTVISTGADVIGHNMEAVPRLFPAVRPQADYRRSLALLERLAKGSREHGFKVKSGLMVGFGERRTEVRSVLKDLRAVGVSAVTVGQYLPPTPDHFPVERFWRPEEFVGIAVHARRLGFSRVLSGPLVRSSYRSG